MKKTLIILLCSMSINASAACTFVDVQGRWDVVLSATDFYSQCNVFFRFDGSLKDGACNNSQGDTVALVSAQVTPKANCSVTISAEDELGISFSGSARLSRDRSVMIGVIQSTQGQVGTVHAVRH